MSQLFTPLSTDRLTIRNRLMRSATAERIADPETGAPSPAQADMYTALARGGIGLIVTGHAYVDRRGKAHPEMASIADDELIAAWRETVHPAQQAGARVIMQINHSGASCDPAITPRPLSPSGVATNKQSTPEAMDKDEIASAIRAFGQAARRAREAGLDGVQIHGAHGYLITQFLSTLTNQRDDEWGGDEVRRRAFLHAVVAEIRRQVGDDYPLWIKLGVAGSAQSGLTLDQGARVAAACVEYGIDGIEISNGWGMPEEVDLEQDGAFRPLAKAVRAAVGPGYPLALVNGFRTRAAMEAALENDLVQMVSLCRPLIAEPDLPGKLQSGQKKVTCVRCNHCWPQEAGLGVRCRNAKVLRQLSPHQQK